MEVRYLTDEDWRIRLENLLNRIDRLAATAPRSIVAAMAAQAKHEDITREVYPATHSADWADACLYILDRAR